MNNWKQFPKNVRVGYILSFLVDFYLPVSVWFFFYSRYLSVAQIALLASFQVIVTNFLEVPTGAFADLVGRKKAIIIAFFTYAAAMFATAFTTHFWLFMVWEFVKGTSNALNSGSLEALVYDTLKENGQEAEYDRVVANNETYVWLGLFISAIVGGFLFHIWFPLPYILQGVIYSVAGISAFFLVEPKLDSVTYSVKTIMAQQVQGIKEIFANAVITHKTLIFVSIGFGYVTAASILGISQAKEYGMDSRGVGLLFGLGYIISAVASQAYPKARRLVGSRTLLCVAIFVLLASFLLAKFVGIVVGSILIVARIASSTTFRNVRSSIMNRHFSSKNRATALSTLNLLTQLPFALLGYLIGIIIDATSPNSFAFFLGIGLLIALVFIQVFIKVISELNKLARS